MALVIANPSTISRLDTLVCRVRQWAEHGHKYVMSSRAVIQYQRRHSQKESTQEQKQATNPSQIPEKQAKNNNNKSNINDFHQTFRSDKRIVISTQKRTQKLDSPGYYLIENHNFQIGFHCNKHLKKKKKPLHLKKKKERLGSSKNRKQSHVLPRR